MNTVNLRLHENFVPSLFIHPVKIASVLSNSYIFCHLHRRRGIGLGPKTLDLASRPNWPFFFGENVLQTHHNIGVWSVWLRADNIYYCYLKTRTIHSKPFLRLLIYHRLFQIISGCSRNNLSWYFVCCCLVMNL